MTPLDQNGPGDRRGAGDRRRQDLPPWHPRRLRGRRGINRRADEDGRPYLVERIPPAAFLVASLVLVMTVVDGALTIALLDQGCEEANPVMRLLLERGTAAFFIGKYALTAAFLPVALVAYRYRLFGTRLRVGHVLPAVAALYVVLIAYQAVLWWRLGGTGRSAPSPVSASVAARG